MSGPRAHDAAVERVVALLEEYADRSGRLGHEFAAAQGLHRTDGAALLSVLRAERAGRPLTPGRLGADLGLSSGATTAALDRLEGLGHLERRRDGDDRRRVTLHHTAAGEAAGRAWFGPLAGRIHDALADHSGDELALVTRFLARMVAVLAERPDAVAGGS